MKSQDDPRWTLRRRDGEIVKISGRMMLIERILDGRTTREDEVLREDGQWVWLGSMQDLEPYFEALEAARPRSRVAIPVGEVEDASRGMTDRRFPVVEDAPPSGQIATPIEPAPSEPASTEPAPSEPAPTDAELAPMDSMATRVPPPPTRGGRALTALVMLAFVAWAGGVLVGRSADSLAVSVAIARMTTPPTAAGVGAAFDPAGALVSRAAAFTAEGSPEALALAKADLAEARLLRPGDSRALAALATLEAEGALFALDEANDAESAALDPRADVRALSLRADDFRDEAEDRLHVARVHAEHAVRDPDCDERAWLALALVRALEGRPGEAAAALTLAGDGPEAELVRGVVAERVNGPMSPDALAHYQAASSASVTASVRLARLLAVRGHPGGARSVLTEALSIAPNDARASSLLRRIGSGPVTHIQ